MIPLRPALALRPLVALLAGLCNSLAADVAFPEAASPSAPPLAQSAPSSSEAPTSPSTEHQTAPSTPDPAAEERASLMRIGATKLASGDHESAVIAYRQVATSTDDPAELANALHGLARAFRMSGQAVKAVATYERLLKDHPAFPDGPVAMLELGRTLRDVGSPKLALSRFYSVLHTTLKLPDAEADAYRRVVRTAQFEIAETQLAMGNFDEAARLFDRLHLLDLAAADRARARFRAAQSRRLAGDLTGAVAALEVLIAEEPGSADAPEARFLLASLFGELGRPADSLRVTLDLLHNQHALGPDSARWRIWQRRTGNQLANQFYTQGEFISALTLYQALAALDNAPDWRAPILYQIALCHERLLQYGDALATHREIVAVAERHPGVFDELARMSAWRIDQLDWWTQTHARLHSLSPPPAP